MGTLVYNLTNVFSTNPQEGVLGKQEANRFYIPPYQRGYKWGSDEMGSPVWQLMDDLKKAFAINQPEYYLQYITLKNTSHQGEKVLEVIDGQQRLTTLTLLFEVVNRKVQSEETPIVRNKLIYGIRAQVNTFFQLFIYGDLSAVLGSDWEAFILEYPDYDEQDIYFLFHATHRIHDELPDSDDELTEFYDCLHRQVKIILNTVGDNLESERVFADLNSNKVPLTETELVKGLLLTKAAREAEEAESKRSFREISDRHAALGRQWDEIAHWTRKKEIAKFYFNSEPQHALLELIKWLLQWIAVLGNEANDTDKSSFLALQRLVNLWEGSKQEDGRSATELFRKLKLLQAILNDWFESDELYNLLGYLKRANRQRYGSARFLLRLLEQTKPELLASLQGEANKYLSQRLEEFDQLEYGVENEKITLLLLALDVFSSRKRFDFYEYEAGRWSLEHIFPQNMDKLIGKNLAPNDRSLILQLCPDPLEDFDPLPHRNFFESEEEVSVVFASLKQKLRTEEGQVYLSDREVELLKKMAHVAKLNTIGNLALLQRGDNSANSNGMFDSKREKIVERISQGSFVPKHTYDVFSKLLSKEMSPELTIWLPGDIAAHGAAIKARLQKIIQNSQEA